MALGLLVGCGASESEPAPQPPPPSDSQLESAIEQSDDFQLYRTEFMTASRGLLERGRCTLADFREMGGWVRSTNHKPDLVYFTYCGKMHVSNRLYVDVATGRIFQ